MYLRLGQFRRSVKDYDSALKRQPKEAWWLYARGLAERGEAAEAKSKGQARAEADADADFKAAVAIDPRVPGRAKRFGMIEAQAAAPPAK